MQSVLSCLTCVPQFYPGSLTGILCNEWEAGGVKNMSVNRWSPRTKLILVLSDATFGFRRSILTLTLEATFGGKSY